MSNVLENVFKFYLLCNMLQLHCRENTCVFQLTKKNCSFNFLECVYQCLKKLWNKLTIWLATQMRWILREEVFVTLDCETLFSKQMQSFIQVYTLQYVRWIAILLALNISLIFSASISKTLFFLIVETILKN